jgi:hypothetical protein
MRKTKSLGVLGLGLGLGGVLALACTPAPADGTTATPAGTPGDGTSSGEVANPVPDPGPGGAGPGTGASSGGPVAANLAITQVKFRQAGRRGDGLFFEVKGKDSLKNTSAVVVELLSASDEPVKAFDTDWDGVLDSGTRRFHFDATTIGQASFTGSVLARGAFWAAVKKVRVVLEDEAGGRSAPMMADIVMQQVREAGDACDPARLADRCQEHMSCSGAPAVCQTAVAPALAKVAYYGGAGGRMMFKGTDPDEDVASVSVEFLDGANKPIAVPWYDDPNAPSTSSLELTVKQPDGSGFFIDTLPSPDFSAQVAKIAATATDAMGFASPRVIVPRAALAVKSAGQACDPDGLDACATGTLCAPGVASAAANTCTSAATVRTKKCSAFGALDPSKGIVRAFGRVEGTSLWDPPAGCVGPEAKGLPETAVPLRLSKPAAKLTISTALPETEFDTVVYLIPACAAAVTDLAPCNDDDKGFTSTLNLTNVPAGDYTIIVESARTRSGRFGLSVKAE